MQYENFELTVSQAQRAGRYRLQARSTTQGDVDATTDLDPAGEPFAEMTEIRKRPTTPAELEQIGTALYRGLFVGGIESLWNRSYGEVSRDPDLGLRLRLRVDPPELAVVPWELLYSPERDLFLATSAKTPLSRHLALPEPVRAIACPEVVRLLAILPESSELDIEAELGILREVAAHLGGKIAVEPLTGRVTSRTIRHALRQRSYQLVHFAGHGAHRNGEALIVLDGESEIPETVPGEAFAQFFLDDASVRLIVLNACGGATRSAQEVLAGVAPHLLRRGVPAVIGMQSPINNHQAVDFATEFYSELTSELRGGQVETALARARTALLQDHPHSPSFAYPVLYLRAPDGRLWDARFSAPPPSDQPTPATEAPGPQPVASIPREGVPPEIRSRILDFGRLIADKTEGFVGRGWIFDAIARFVGEQPRGYFLLLGDPGIGKSAIMARLVQRQGYAHHFNIRAEGLIRTEDFLANMCAQLIADHGLGHTFLPPEATRDAQFLKGLLEQVSSRLRPQGEKVVLLVDALDEADLSAQAPGVNPLYLPPTLPEGVYVIVSSRRGTRLAIQCELDQLEILQDEAGNLADVRLFVESKLAVPGIRAYIEAQKLDDESFVAELVDKSQGNFMYLRYVLPEIARGSYKDRKFATLPMGLDSYYEDHWSRMRSRNEEEWLHHQLSVLVALTVVKEPVSVDLIVDFSGVEDRRRIRKVLVEWDPFLYATDVLADAGEPQRRYRLYHESFHDFIKAKDEVAGEHVDLKAAHGRIADVLWQELYG